uniref:Uncharacterized protein n=1 Tax=Caenorhabditis japonica TaxID=281687 RepID=A0A8R1IQ40_CAEJA
MSGFEMSRFRDVRFRDVAEPCACPASERCEFEFLCWSRALSSLSPCSLETDTPRNSVTDPNGILYIRMIF